MKKDKLLAMLFKVR